METDAILMRSGNKFEKYESHIGRERKLIIGCEEWLTGN
jgi:hypothetical protein